jgi:hypothetical protein
MKRLIAAIVVAALIAPALPAFAAEGTESPKPAVSLRESATRAVATDTKASANANAYGPRSMPRQPNDGVRNQGGGGGHVGTIIGIVSAAAGIAATVYMVKVMKKSTSDANKTN